jgi:uncharacterized OB-fold protein
MTEPLSAVVMEVDQRIVAKCRYYTGRMGSAFYARLRDEMKIMGVRCVKCGKVFWPPRSTCGICFSGLSQSDMVEIGPEGTLETFALVTYAETVHPRPAPFMYGIVKLDGADTGLTHFIEGLSVKEARIGMRMRPVFAESRNGNILDIHHFEPAPSEG